jgi:acetyl esterase/lipase
MMIDRRTALSVGLMGPALLAARSAAAATAASPQPAEPLRLWPGGAPGGAGVHVTYKVAEVVDQGQIGRDISGVLDPLVSLHRAAAASDTAILVIPGGAFNRVVFDKEGEEVCRWLAAHGVSAGALLYRLPGDGWTAKEDAPVQDAKRALRLLARATGAKRLGVLGFSAGGTIAAGLATRWDAVDYPAVDVADAIDARPGFMGLGYAYLNIPPPPPPLTSMFHGMTATTPPTFFFHAADDPRVKVDNSIDAFKALNDAHVATALHIFESGRHGFGLRPPVGSSAAAWPEIFLSWMKAGGHLA